MNKESANEAKEPNDDNRQKLLCQTQNEEKASPEEAIDVSHGNGDGIHVSADNSQDAHENGLPESKSSDLESGDSSGDSSDSSETDDSEEEDSDDPNDAGPVYKGQHKNYKDFFEGSALFLRKKIVKYAIFAPDEVYQDYKQMFGNMQKIVGDVPNAYKYDISSLLYPSLVLGYLRMVIGGKFKMAKQFLAENEDYLDDIYDRSIAKLKHIRRPRQVSGRARELVFGYDIVLLEMPRETLRQLLENISNWQLAHQELFMGHFVIDGFYKDSPRCKRPPLSRPPLEDICWADRTNASNNILQPDRRNSEIKSCFLNPPVIHETDEVVCGICTQDGCYVAMTTQEYSILLFSVELDRNITILKVLTGHKGRVYTGDISPDKRFLITCSQDGTMRLWCLVFGVCMAVYDQISPARSVVFAPVEHFFATASEDGVARVWIKTCDEPIMQISGHLAELDVCIFHPNSRYLATGSADLTVRMWDVANKGEQVRLFYGHYKAITALAFSRSGRYLVSGGQDFLFVIWDTTNESALRSLLHHTATINTIDFAMDDSRLAVGCQGTYLSIWNFDNILKSEETRDLPTLVLSHPNTGGPIFKTRFVEHGVLISIFNRSLNHENENKFENKTENVNKTKPKTKKKK
ncbi:transcription initiation factor TFIID subunit 5-like [Drosophila madeirensis]|uniref:Transcription initiation factor TFIID subunit 5-like n=1 Tax=Drosophila madeirensis TaxID=30013 RepID=A0AAU9FHJ3_DROMD